MGLSRWIPWLVLAGLSACSQPPVPADNFYRLYTESSPVGSASPALDGVLVVRQFLADGLISERPVVYGTGGEANPLQQYHYHYWTESPTRMLQELMVPFLREANVAREVITPELRTPAEFELTGKIRRLEQIRGASARVVVELEFGLNRPRDSTLLLVRGYAAEMDCEDESIVAAVRAFNKALTQIYTQLAEDVRKL